MCSHSTVRLGLLDACLIVTGGQIKSSFLVNPMFSSAPACQGRRVANEASLLLGHCLCTVSDKAGVATTLLLRDTCAICHTVLDEPGLVIDAALLHCGNTQQPALKHLKVTAAYIVLAGGNVKLITTLGNGHPAWEAKFIADLRDIDAVI